VRVVPPEEWRRIPGIHDGYEVSNLGRVRSWLLCGHGAVRRRSSPRQRKLVPCVKDGYLAVVLTGDSKKLTLHKVHTLVLLAFVGPKPYPAAECRHLDGDRTNNRSDNLVWGSHKENVEDQARHGTFTTGERNAGAKLTNQQALAIRASRLRGKDLALKYGVSQATISRIKHRVRYACASEVA
jgi:hypothetical protein